MQVRNPPFEDQRSTVNLGSRGRRGGPTRDQLVGFLSLLALLTNLGGCSTEACSGKFACANYGALQCATLDGCFPTSPQCISTPSSTSGNETSRCAIYAPFEDLCRAAVPWCIWSNATCVNGCTLSTDEASCQEASATYGGCVWAECSGAPTRQCGQYPVDKCPTAPSGCYLESRSWLGD